MPRRFDSLVFLAVTARAPQIEWAIPTLPWQSNAPAPPVSETAKALASETLSQALADNTVVIFSRGRCAATKRVQSYFEDLGNRSPRLCGAPLRTHLHAATRLPTARTLLRRH